MIGPYRNGRHIPPADRVKFDAPFLVDLESDIGETTDVSKGNPAVVKCLLALAEAMREDLGDYDRVGENMRFFEADLTRRTKPVLEKNSKQSPYFPNFPDDQEPTNDRSRRHLVASVIRRGGAAEHPLHSGR